MMRTLLISTVAFLLLNPNALAQEEGGGRFQMSGPAPIVVIDTAWGEVKERHALEELRSIGVIVVQGENDELNLALVQIGTLSDGNLERLVQIAPSLRKLTSLDLSFTHQITSLEPLKGMPLTSLDLSNASGFTSLEPLEGMPLTSLSLRNADGITSLGPLEGMPLTSLDLSYADGFTSLEPLRGMPLTSLNLSAASGITSLVGLEGMPLTSLDLSYAYGITSLGPLEGMPLTSLNLTDTYRITSLEPLKGMDPRIISGASDELLTTME